MGYLKYYDFAEIGSKRSENGKDVRGKWEEGDRGRRTAMVGVGKRRKQE